MLTIDEIKNYNKIVEDIAGDNLTKSTLLASAALSQYYAQLGRVYRTFHSEEGAMHFPIKFSEDQKHKEKLLYQAQTVENIIKNKNGANVLELGCGMGFNTIYLATNNPTVQFDAIDLAASNIKVAKRNASKLANTTFLEMDFDKLEMPNKKYDVIFGVETLCYSNDLNKLLNSLTHTLAPDGQIIIFDAYINQFADQLNDTEHKAYQLLLWGWYLDQFESLKNLTAESNSKLYEVKKVVDYSGNIMSNNLAYQKGSMLAFNYPKILKLLYALRILPLSYIKQITAGLYSAYFVQRKYLGYYELIITLK